MALLIISAITASLIPVYAVPTALSEEKTVDVKPIRISENKRVSTNAFTNVRRLEAVDLSTLDESSIDERINEARNADSIDDESAAPLWYLNSYGYTTITSPVTDAAEIRIRIRLQMIAEKVKVTELGYCTRYTGEE